MRAGILSLAVALIVALAPGGASAGRIFGLVIGIDDYRHITDLQGAVNDAADISDALTGLGAEVVTLLDGKATRDAILAEWRRLATGLQQGDQLIVSYAGHGTNEPERVAGNEADGRDETLLLSGFAPYGKAAGERILDDEIAELIALAGEGRTIFVADACHSGTLSRNVAPALGFRYVSVGRIEADPLPPPPPRAGPAEGRDNAALFLAASDDSEKTPEFLIDGKPRGALSYAFAASLRGKADANADGILMKGEIETYVRRTVRGISQGSQRPQVAPAGESDKVVVALSRQTPQEASTATAITELAFDALPPVTLSHNGGAGADRMLKALSGVELVPDGQTADLRLDLKTGAVLSMVGDTLRHVEPGLGAAAARELQAVADKQRLASALSAMQGELDLSFADGDRSYHADDVVTVRVTGRRAEGLLILNITSDGRVHHLYPLSDLGDPALLPPGHKLNLALQVAAPFGADHVIAVETDGPASDLRRALQGATDAAAFWESFRAIARTLSTPPRIAVFPFHTVPG